MLHVLSPLNRHRWIRIAVFSVIHMYIALSYGLICVPLNNLYVCNTCNSFSDMSHACVYMSTYPQLASLAPHPLRLLYTSRMPALAVLVKRRNIFSRHRCLDLRRSRGTHPNTHTLQKDPPTPFKKILFSIFGAKIQVYGVKYMAPKLKYSLIGGS